MKSVVGWLLVLWWARRRHGTGAAVAVALGALALFASRARSRRKKLCFLKRHVDTPAPYAACEEAFRANFSEDRELGAQVCAFVKGAKVLDLCGARDAQSFNDLTIVYSCTKVVESLVVAMLVDQNKLAYEDPIAKHWPEFGQVFSPHTTVAQLMRHEAGLGEIQQTLSTADANEVFADVAKLQRWLLTSMKQRKDGATTYHALTRGFYVDVLCYLCDGRRIRDYIREEVVGKLQPADPRCEFYVGCETESVYGRTTACVPSSSWFGAAVDYAVCKSGAGSVLRRGGDEDPDYLLPFEADLLAEFLKGVVFGPEYSRVTKSFRMMSEVGHDLQDTANHEQMRKLPLSSVMGSTNAYSLARIGSELAMGGGAFLSPDAFAMAEVSFGKRRDQVFQLDLDFTSCGWGRGRFHPDWVGWDGAGGSMFVWSSKHQASFAYVPSMLDVRTQRVRGQRILNELIQVLEEGVAAGGG